MTRWHRHEVERRWTAYLGAFIHLRGNATRRMMDPVWSVGFRYIANMHSLEQQALLRVDRRARLGWNIGFIQKLCRGLVKTTLRAVVVYVDIEPAGRGDIS